MKEVLRKLDAIQSCVTNKKKIALLREFIRHDDLFKKVIIFGTSDTIHFNMKILPRIRYNDSEYKPGIDREKILNELFYHLDYLSKNPNASKEDKEWIAKLADNLEFGRKIVNRILEKKMQCRVTSRSVNDAIPGLVESLPRIQPSKEDKIENITFPAMCDEESRGMYFNVLVEKKKVRYLSMFGVEYKIKNKKLDNSFLKIAKGLDIALMGYGRLRLKGKFETKRENALFKKFLRDKAPQEYHDGMIFFIHEIIPINDFWNGKCNVDLKSRYDSMFFKELNSKRGRVRIPKRKIVNSYEESVEFANELINDGGLGVIVKDLKSYWKDRSSVYWVEIRKKVKCNMQIVGFKKNEELYCQSSDGFVKCIINVGDVFDWENIVGKNCIVKFSEIISKRGKVAKSFFCCQYIQMTDQEPNALSEIKEFRKIAKTRIHKNT